MVTINPTILQGFAKDLMQAAGGLESEAIIIARHLVAANLAEHDSHGVINISMYIDYMRKGHMIPCMEPTTKNDFL
tara:strand:+ start:484 stop:711 length:228 start_codon:yes stop_codon:yes gene_type:complete